MAEAAKTEATKTTESTKPGSKMRKPKSFVLGRSGIVVEFDRDFSTDDAIAAQRAAGKNGSALALYLAQRICTFDGKMLTLGELKEKVRGTDYFELIGELLGDDAKPDEDDAGN